MRQRIFPLHFCLVGALSMPVLWADTSTATMSEGKGDGSVMVSTIPEEELKTFAAVYDIVEQNYAGEVNGEKMINDAIRGMVAGLDPYSTFYSPEEFRRTQEVVEGEYAGVGLVLDVRSGQVVIASVLDESPARKARVQAGDILLRVDNQPATPDLLDKVRDMLLGDPETQVNVTIVDHFGDTRRLQLLRELIEIDTHVVQRFGDVGYTRIGAFNKSTMERLRPEITTLVANGAQGLILDLRNNPGGLMDQAIEMVDLFVEEGTIASTDGRGEQANISYPAGKGDILDGKPIIVMINKGSASASEIVSGSLQDMRRAMVVGQASYGKASIQSVSELPSGAGLRLTIGHYYLPNGEAIEEVGITPDVELDVVKLDPDALLTNIELAEELKAVDVSQLTDEEVESFQQKQIAHLTVTDPNLATTIQLMKTLIFAHKNAKPVEKTNDIAPVEATETATETTE